MFAVIDINTSWRLKPFEALGKLTCTVGLEPMDALRAINLRKLPLFGKRKHISDEMMRIPVLMPFRWGRRSEQSCERMLRVTEKFAASFGESLTGLVVTSPHYSAMPALCDGHYPVYYYCSDDYRTYDGWGGGQMVEAEKALVQRVKHSFFVSQMLADRAIKEYGVSSSVITVCPNATSHNFLKPVPETEIDNFLARHPRIKRPVVGVVGGINDRLDFDLLLKCSKLQEVGSLVMVGGVDKNLQDPRLKILLNETKCVFVGAQPHKDLPVWMQLFDVALIPYRDTPLNRACSPMRLFDHLASKRPIVATHWCDQINHYKSNVHIGNSTSEILDILTKLLKGTPNRLTDSISGPITWEDRGLIIAEVIGLQDLS